MTRRLATLLVLWLVPSFAAAATVRLTITGIRNGHGMVLATLCTRADFLRPRCPWRGHAAARAGNVELMIDGVPPGIYAVQAFHDENGNGHLDRSMLGLPEEGMGFSNDARMRMGPPRFVDASVPVTAAGAVLHLRMRYP